MRETNHKDSCLLSVAGVVQCVGAFTPWAVTILIVALSFNIFSHFTFMLFISSSPRYADQNQMGYKRMHG